MIQIFNGNVELLRPVAESWRYESNPEAFGLTGDIDCFLKDLKKLIDGPNSDLLVMDNLGGFMGLTIFTSPLGCERIANEHYWYVLPEYRGVSSLRFLRAANRWAKAKGCSHIIMNASCLASDLHDRVCRLYEHFGMKKFETEYMRRVE